jgi:hypothetical protein
MSKNFSSYKDIKRGLQNGAVTAEEPGKGLPEADKGKHPFKCF